MPEYSIVRASLFSKTTESARPPTSASLSASKRLASLKAGRLRRSSEMT
jgi:hypothetical protein